MQLLRRNCDYDTKNAAGKEAWQLAFEFNYSELGEYIRDKTGLPPLGEGQIAANVADSGGGGGEEENDDGFLDLLGEFGSNIHICICMYFPFLCVCFSACLYVCAQVRKCVAYVCA